MTSSWRCVVRVALFAAAGAAARAESGAIELAADAAAAGRPLDHAWSRLVGAGRAAEGLRASWLDALHTAAGEGGFAAVRIDGLFDDDLHVGGERNGRPGYTFQYLDDLFDRLLTQNVRPFLVLTPFDRDARAAPPRADAAWTALVEALLRHCEDRYGQTELRQWRVEVRCEPTERSYEGYARTAAAVKRVDPQLKVGGPAFTRGGQDGLPVFLQWERQHGAPVDFVSLRAYPFADGPADITRQDVIAARRVIHAGPFPEAQLEVTAWGSSGADTDYTRDSLPEGAWILKSNLEVAGLAQAIAYQSFTDVFEAAGAGGTLFHGGPGLITYPGVVKPAFHAYRYLNALGDEAISEVPGGIVTRRKTSGRLVALAYNFPAEQRTVLPVSATLGEADRLTASGSSRTLSLRLTGLRPAGQVLIEWVDRRHGNATAAWEEMGRVADPSRSALDDLRSAARAVEVEYRQADDLGHFQLTRTLAPWSMLLLRQL